MEELLLVDVKDAHGALWSVPASRIRLVKHLGSGSNIYDRIVADGDEELLVCTYGGDPTTLGESMYLMKPHKKGEGRYKQALD